MIKTPCSNAVTQPTVRTSGADEGNAKGRWSLGPPIPTHLLQSSAMSKRMGGRGADESASQSSQSSRHPAGEKERERESERRILRHYKYLRLRHLGRLVTSETISIATGTVKLLQGEATPWPSEGEQNQRTKQASQTFQTSMRGALTQARNRELHSTCNSNSAMLTTTLRRGVRENGRDSSQPARVVLLPSLILPGPTNNSNTCAGLSSGVLVASTEDASAMKNRGEELHTHSLLVACSATSSPLSHSLSYTTSLFRSVVVATSDFTFHFFSVNWLFSGSLALLYGDTCFSSQFSHLSS